MKIKLVPWMILIGVVLGGVYFSFSKNPQRIDIGKDGIQVTPTQTPQASKDDLIVLDSPREGEKISSPLKITGKARGNWFFEASFPVILTDWDGKIIAEGIATAQGEWMTEEYVPFIAELEFEKPSYGERGALILQKDNPSGLPENDNALEITVFFE